MEYLFSQTGAVLQQELPNPNEEEAGEGSDEGFEEEEEPEEIRLLEHHSALLQSSNLTRPMDQMEVQQAEAEEEEEEDVLGPDGQGGYQHIVVLAQALVELRHRRYVTPRQAREVTALWLKLSGWDKAAVKFLPPSPSPSPGPSRPGLIPDHQADRSHARGGQCEAVSSHNRFPSFVWFLSCPVSH